MNIKLHLYLFLFLIIFIQYLEVFINLKTGLYLNKKDFWIDMIPFSNIRYVPKYIMNLITNYKKLR